MIVATREAEGVSCLKSKTTPSGAVSRWPRPASWSSRGLPARGRAALYIDHVGAPALRARRGGRFMENLVEAARAEGATLVPICSYAVQWLARHPEASRGVV